MGKYRTKVERPTHSPFLGVELRPDQVVDLPDEQAQRCCDRTETVEYPDTQASDMEAQGFEVEVEERDTPDDEDEVAELRRRGYRFVNRRGQPRRYRVAVGRRKVAGILEPVDGFEDLTVNELRDRLGARGLPVSGTKSELIARLEGREEAADEE